MGKKDKKKSKKKTKGKPELPPKVQPSEQAGDSTPVRSIVAKVKWIKVTRKDEHDTMEQFKDTVFFKLENDSEMHHGYYPLASSTEASWTTTLVKHMLDKNDVTITFLAMSEQKQYVYGRGSKPTGTMGPLPMYIAPETTYHKTTDVT